MDNIKSKISCDLAKKIFANRGKATEYLLRLNKTKELSYLKFDTISRGQNKGKQVLDAKRDDFWKYIIKSWDYKESKKIIRDLFKETDKYKRGKEADKVMDGLVRDWRSLKLGDVAWPFSQGAFDEFVQRVNSERNSELAKDEKVKDAAVRYRRIKEINTVRNDFIETLIFEKNDNILPTLNHRRGVDFFIQGVSFDQKVAKSPTNEFKIHFKDKWRKTAIENPQLVAEYLYKYQDEGRFGADPRLLVVYVDEDVSIDKIREIISRTDFRYPIEIDFSYKHKNLGVKNYRVSCFVVLLHN